MTNITPKPFQIHVPDEALADLRARLSHVRWPDEPPLAPWSTGTSVGYMQELVEYWRERFDWRAQEAKLNAFRQFTVPLAGIDVHLIHEPGKGPNPTPLLLSHGWPGSVFEFHKIIPMLTDPARFGDLRDLADVVSYRGFWRLARRHWRTGASEFWRDYRKAAFPGRDPALCTSRRWR